MRRNQKRKIQTKRQIKNQRRRNEQSLSEGYLICGRNTVLDGLKLGNVQKVFISNQVERKEKVNEIIDKARELNIRVEFIDKREIEKLAKGYDNHQGVAALCKKARRIDLVDFLHDVEKKENACMVMLTEIEYEQNLGAILRTLDASGVDGVILSNRIKNQDSIVVKRISMGASESVPMFSQNIFIAAKILKDHGFRIIGVESTGKELYINEDFSGKIALVFGGEDKSLSDPVTDICDKVVSIPMKGYVTSLNVSVSVAVVTYERLRQTLKNQI